jgi:protein kinase/serine/threonine-protein kinase
MLAPGIAWGASWTREARLLLSKGRVVNRLKRIIHEIHRRSLWQVMGIYVVGSWAVIEAIQGLTEATGLPVWLPPFAVALLLIGFPVVMATAFVQEGIGAGSQERAVASDPEIYGVAAPAEAPRDDTGAHSILTWRNALTGGVLALALWGLVAVGWVLLGPGPVPSAADSADGVGNSIAVLPFANISADEENTYFTQGIHDDVLTQLSKIGALDVIARTSVLQYADTDRPIPAIAAELGVATVVEGGVQRSGNRVRINAQLIHAESNTHLWAETYDRELTAENVFTVQTEIAQAIADALRATLTPEEESRIASVPTANLTAYDFYLKGREAYQRYQAEDNNEAIRLFRQALELDPGYARAWAGLGDAFGQRPSRYGFPISWADSAIAASRRAIEIDPELADGYKAMGLAYTAQGQSDRALEYYRRTVELDPNHSPAANNIGLLSFQRGEFDEYLRWSRKAFSLEPTDIGRRATVAWAYWSLEEYDLAETWAREALALQPDALVTLDILSTLASHRGEFAHGLELAEQVLSQHPNSLAAHQIVAGIALFARDMERARTAAEEAARLDVSGFSHQWHASSTMLGFTLLATGDDERGRRQLTETLERAEPRLERQSWSASWEMASIHAALGNLDEAIHWAERSYEEWGYRFPRFIAIDPLWDSARDDPRFQALIARMQADVDEMRHEIELEEIAAGER